MNTEINEPIEEVGLEVVPVSALEAQETAQINTQISTAKKYPRPLLSVIKRHMLDFATLDEDTAQGCFYVLKRKGAEGEKTIQGPSARLAEIALSCYGNVRATSRVIATDDKNVTAQAICHDLEKNVCVGIEVKRRITDRNGKLFSNDMVVVTGNAACSIALRNAVFKTIPMALIKPVYEAARLCAVGDATTLSTRREKMVEAFSKMGVSKEKILGQMNKPKMEDIDLADLEILIGLHTAIKDGDTSIDEAFPAPLVSKPIFSKSVEKEASK